MAKVKFVTSNGMKVERVSRWIRLNNEYITRRSKFYGYSDDGSLIYFKFEGRRIPLGQFMRFPDTKCPVINDGNDTIILAGYNSTEYYRPLMIEIDKGGEAIRLYREVE